MPQHRGIFLKHRTRLGIHDVFFQRNEAVAPTDHKYFIEQLEQLKKIFLTRRFSGERLLHFMNDLHDDMEGRRDHEHASGDTQNNHKLRDVEQDRRVAAGQHEAAKR